jgi:hypothetical protein
VVRGASSGDKASCISGDLSYGHPPQQFRRLALNEALTRTFRDAYLRREIAFAQFSTSNSARADDAEQQTRYQEYADAQHAFFEAANVLARNLLNQGDAPQIERPIVEAELRPASNTNNTQALGALRQINTALMNLSARSKRQ